MLIHFHANSYVKIAILSKPLKFNIYALTTIQFIGPLRNKDTIQLFVHSNKKLGQFLTNNNVVVAPRGNKN